MICELSLNLGGSKDHEWCEHMSGKDYRTILAKQGAEQEDVHRITLESLQLPVIQGNRQNTNSITNVSKYVSEKLANNPKGGDESTDDENDGSDIQAFNIMDLGDDSDSIVELLESRLLSCTGSARSRFDRLKEEDRVKQVFLFFYFFSVSCFWSRSICRVLICFFTGSTSIPRNMFDCI